MDPPLATTETISNRINNSGSTSVIKYLRSGKNFYATAAIVEEKGVRICDRNNSADTRSVNREGETVPQAPEQRFSYSP